MIEKKAYCSMCGKGMKYVKTKKDQHARDMKGELVPVSRVFFACPNCKTVQWYNMREDGKTGDLAQMLKVVGKDAIEQHKLKGDLNRVY